MELFKSIAHPTELWALLKFKYGGGKEMVMPKVEYVSAQPQILFVKLYPVLRTIDEL